MLQSHATSVVLFDTQPAVTYDPPRYTTVGGDRLAQPKTAWGSVGVTSATTLDQDQHCAPIDAGYITVAQVDTDGNKTLRTVRRTESASRTYLDPVFFNPVYGPQPPSLPVQPVQPAQRTQTRLPLAPLPVDDGHAQVLDVHSEDAEMMEAISTALSAAMDLDALD
jgi:hypothetical protein